ncbi:origin recognition complex subunit 2 [Chiloscyllium plagiosum]|uniref:origin recognition complex subunit 2 n=1 Tax=Chiloscyllium plagiosum TaxID=36176 RepID=UPI001CB88094|nr:origin recognition complex subunit 2 [Chiloscyllium plagiosum]
MMKVGDVRFIGDEEVVEHITEKRHGINQKNNVRRTLLNVKQDSQKWEKTEQAQESLEVFNERDYVEVLGAGDSGCQGDLSDEISAAGRDLFTFQTIKRADKMAKLASELAQTPGKSVTFCAAGQQLTAGQIRDKGQSNQHKTPSKSKRKYVSTTPYRLRKRLTDLADLSSSSESDFSSSDSEGGEESTPGGVSNPRLMPEAVTPTPAPGKTAVKKSRKLAAPSLVELYFEAHSSSKVLTSDRTLQKLQTPKLDQETLERLLSDDHVPFAPEIRQLNKQHEKLFRKWMLQTQLGFSLVLYGLGSKRELLEEFRCQMLQGAVHVVVNGFFPSITLKSILNSITEEVLGYEGTFRNPVDQLNYIIRAFQEDSTLDLYLLIHNIDGQMLRGDRNQQILGQLSAIPGIHLLASIDHLNAPLMWDQTRSCLFNWLWYEVTTFKSYAEETSYENSLLVKQSGALALSSLIHVLRSLTPNARGIFKLLARFQLENKDNSYYPGLSFQDFYQRCRDAFLVNSNLTLRAQLTEFRDHKLIRNKKGADGVEYLIIPVDMATLTDFLEMEDKET